MQRICVQIGGDCEHSLIISISLSTNEVTRLCGVTCNNGSRGAGAHDDKVTLRAPLQRGLKELSHIAVVVVGGQDGTERIGPLLCTACFSAHRRCPSDLNIPDERALKKL